jgi:hypothetical protein
MARKPQNHICWQVFVTQFVLMVVGLASVSLAQAEIRDNAALLCFQAFKNLNINDFTDDELNLLRKSKKEYDKLNDVEALSNLVHQGNRRSAIMLAERASHMSRCHWGLLPEESAIDLWSPSTDLFVLKKFLVLESKLCMFEGDCQAALERYLTLHRLAKQFDKEHELIYMPESIELAVLTGLMDMVQVASHDPETLRKIKDCLTDDHQTFSFAQELKYRHDEILRHCPSQTGFAAKIKALGGDPNDWPFWTGLHLTREEWVRFRTKPYTDYINGVVELLRQGLPFHVTHERIGSLCDEYDKTVMNSLDIPHLYSRYEVSRRPLESLNDRIPEEQKKALGQSWALYKDEFSDSVSVYYTFNIRIKIVTDAIKNAVDVYLLIDKNGTIPENFPLSIAKDHKTGYDFQYKRIPEGFVFRYKSPLGTHEKDPVDEFIFKVTSGS